MDTVRGKSKGYGKRSTPLPYPFYPFYQKKRVKRVRVRGLFFGKGYGKGPFSLVKGTVFFFRKDTSKGRLLFLTSKRYGKESKKGYSFFLRVRVDSFFLRVRG